MDLSAFEEHLRFESKHWWFVGRRQIIGKVAKALDPRRAFEIGCGTGGNVAYLANHFPCKGADISGHAIGIAREAYRDHDFVHYRQFDEIESLVGESDLLLLLDVLEHVPDDFELLSTLIAAMRPGSHLILTVPAEPRLWSSHDEALFHYRRYSANRLSKVWESQPVDVRLFSSMNHRLGGLIRTVRKVSSMRGTNREAKSDLSMPHPILNRLLAAVFASESERHLSGIDKRTSQPKRQRFGVSWLVVLRRGSGEVVSKTKPPDLQDQFSPPEFEYGIA